MKKRICSEDVRGRREIEEKRLLMERMERTGKLQQEKWRKVLEEEVAERKGTRREEAVDGRKSKKRKSLKKKKREE